MMALLVPLTTSLDEFISRSIRVVMIAFLFSGPCQVASDDGSARGSGRLEARDKKAD